MGKERGPRELIHAKRRVSRLLALALLLMFGNLICYAHCQSQGFLSLLYESTGSDIERKACQVIADSRDKFKEHAFYHWVSEFKSLWKPIDAWDRKEQYCKTWIDDVFYMHCAYYDYQFLKYALDTFADATRRLNGISCTPVYFDVRMLYGITDWIDKRSYGALYFNIMVYDYVKVTGDFAGAGKWKDVVLKNYRYIRDNYMKTGVHFDDKETCLQPDYVRKSGYIADMTIYYLISLKAMQYVYGMDCEKEFEYVTDKLINTLWQDEKGFFIDWIDPNGSKHIHYGTEQLWGIVYDVLPISIQQAMFEALPKDDEHCGRFWQYKIYDQNEKVAEWDFSWKLGQSMLYLQTLRKFDYDESFIQQQIERYNQAIQKYGFCDNYLMDSNGEFLNNGLCNYIMNAGSWITILKNNDLSVVRLAEISSQRSQ